MKGAAGKSDLRSDPEAAQPSQRLPLDPADVLTVGDPVSQRREFPERLMLDSGQRRPKLIDDFAERGEKPDIFRPVGRCGMRGGIGEEWRPARAPHAVLPGGFDDVAWPPALDPNRRRG